MAHFNYNWNNSSYQSTPANYFYHTSTTSNVYQEINPFIPLNGSYVATPTNENKTFSSGYGSENTSFNSPPVMKLNYGLSPNNLQNQLPIANIVENRSKSNKRSRDFNESFSALYHESNNLNDFQEPKCKKTKSTNNKFLEEFDENDYENFDFSLSGSQLDSQLSQDKKKRVLTRNQRIAANMRERKRMCIMNDCFVKLREALPITTGRKRRKMSRLDIVVGAMEYIAYLEQLLEKDIPGEIDFEAYQNSLYLI